MYETIETPRIGQPLRAAWASRLANRVNELCTAVSPGMLQRDGIGGVGAEPIPVSRRLPRTQSTATGSPKPFDIEEKLDDDGNVAKDEDGNTVYQVVRCSIPCPSKIYSASSNYDITESRNPIYLHVDRSSDDYVITVDQVTRENTGSHAQFKLYELEDGDTIKIKLDCRPTVAPVFEI